MTKLTPILLGLTFVIAVAALVLALWPVVADAPWEDGVTEPELREIIQTEHEASSKASKEEQEAERVAKCQTAIRLKGTTNNRFTDRAQAEVFSTLMENHCLSSP